MRVILSSYTLDPTLAIARAAKTCYSDGDYEIVTGKVEDKDSREKMIKNIIDSSHGSCLEHAVFTFFVEGISRACTHQLVRHRIASYEQRSQRYIDEGDFEYVTPHSIENSDNNTAYQTIMNTINTQYKELVQAGIPKEDARYILPNACSSTITITMNLRSLRNFFELRMCNRAQWEIQELAEMMYNLIEEVDPILVYKSGPRCMTGVCTENNKTSNCPFKRNIHLNNKPTPIIESSQDWWDNWGGTNEDDEEIKSPDFGKIDMSKYMRGSVLTPDSNKNG